MQKIISGREMTTTIPIFTSNSFQDFSVFVDSCFFCCLKEDKGENIYKEVFGFLNNLEVSGSIQDRVEEEP